MTPTNAAAPLVPLLTQAAALGEGLQWHGPSGRWWWTDIEGRSLHAWTPGALLLAMAKRLAWLRLPDLKACGELAVQPEEILPLEAQLPTTRANDGRCDRAGNFVFGTLDEADPRQRIASFYQYSQAHGLRRLALDGVAISNSICFSPDGRRMYYCDTTIARILVCDYDADSARVSEPRLFIKKEFEEDCWPDGSVVDAKGCLWNAEWGNAAVARYAPDGRLLARHAVPARQVTCPALGGAGGDQLAVTTARIGLSTAELMAKPLSGSLFALPVEPGLYLPDALFNDA